MGKEFQKGAFPTLFHFVRVSAAFQPHVCKWKVSIFVLQLPLGVVAKLCQDCMFLFWEMKKKRVEEEKDAAALVKLLDDLQHEHRTTTAVMQWQFIG